MQRLFKLWRIFVEAIFILRSEQMTIARIRQIVTRFALAISCFVLVFSAARTNAQTIKDSLECGFKRTINLGSVLAGGTLTDSLVLYNSDSSSKDSQFTISSSTDSGFSWIKNNISIRQDSIGYTTTISFSHSTLGFDTASLIFSADSTSCQTTFQLIAQVVGPDTDGAIVELDKSSKDIIAFKSDTSNETLQIQFQNNFGVSLPIDTLVLQNDTAFSIVSSSIKFPDTLPAGASFTLKLAFIARKPGFYTDDVIMPGHSILPLSVQGILQPKDAVEIQPLGTIYFYLYPNPSPGLLTIHTENINTAHVTITDVLGRVEQQTDFTGDWIWDGTSVIDGTYFANITATTSSGFQVHEIRRIVILH
jgi:Secretion system C-terminal sorting domain